jgi:hypothetical protein
VAESTDNNLRLLFHKACEEIKPPEDGHQRLISAAMNIPPQAAVQNGRKSAAINDNLKQVSNQLLHILLGAKEVNQL